MEVYSKFGGVKDMIKGRSCKSSLDIVKKKKLTVSDSETVVDRLEDGSQLSLLPNVLEYGQGLFGL